MMRNRQTFYTLFLSAAILLSFSAYGDIKSVHPLDAYTLFQKNKKAILLDVRTAPEIRQGFIKGATHIDYHGPDFEGDVKKLNKKRTYIIYCATGYRSSKALTIMKRLGFKSVYEIDGGIDAWHRAGYPVAH